MTLSRRGSLASWSGTLSIPRQECCKSPTWDAIGRRCGTRRVQDLSLNKNTEGVRDIAERLDELRTYAALILASEIGENVDVVHAKTMRERTRRISAYVKTMASGEAMEAALRIPHTAGHMIMTVDLRAQQIAASLEVRAPQDKGERGQVGWLLGQLSDTSGDVVIKACAKNAWVPIAGSLDSARANRTALLLSDRSPAHRFVLVKRAPMSVHRKATALDRQTDQKLQ